MIDKIALLDFIFSSNPNRTELMGYTSGGNSDKFKIGIYRNHSFELIDKTIQPYLSLSGMSSEFIYSDYDDSLTFFDVELDVDLLVLWLDVSRYNSDKMESFINERLRELKKQFNKSILVATFNGAIEINDKSFCHYDIDKWKVILGDGFIDERLERFSGTKMGMKTCESVSRDLGLNYFPALLLPGLKCVVVDLDNTLYQGVLGEDGIDGVVFKPEHIQLHQKLKSLAQEGVFICIASKNDHDDVIDFIKNRTDFVLNEDDFTCIAANWNSKAESIASFEKTLNIHSSSFLFVDDNMGELLSVTNTHPEIKFIHAKDDPAITLDALSNYPALLKLNVGTEDRLRSQDTKANSKRVELKSSLSKEDYIRSLDMELTYTIDSCEQSERIYELANKTNQFIFSYKRYELTEVEDLMKADDTKLVSVSLKDKLSDSGIIGVVVVQRNKDGSAELQECFVSCRALGRGVDRAVVIGAIKQAIIGLGLTKLYVKFKEGPRNKPALDFINKHLKEYTLEASEFTYNDMNDELKIQVKG
ncbi:MULTISPECIES: HAD-IIIC family phosphatase [unclassified Vibrio]|uniref:HAD-IIIC family phosphatase n=2 Tax=Vibrio TaxID=662 RepID=UPI003551CEF4